MAEYYVVGKLLGIYPQKEFFSHFSVKIFFHEKSAGEKLTNFFTLNADISKMKIKEYKMEVTTLHKFA